MQKINQKHNKSELNRYKPYNLEKIQFDNEESNQLHDNYIKKSKINSKINRVEKNTVGSINNNKFKRRKKGTFI